MKEYSSEELKKKAASLTERAREVLNSVDTVDAIDAIKTKHTLSDEQRSSLNKIVGYYILGFLPENQVITELMAQLHIGEPKGREIQKDLSNLIFDELKKPSPASEPEKDTSESEEDSMPHPNTPLSSTPQPITFPITSKSAFPTSSEKVFHTTITPTPTPSITADVPATSSQTKPSAFSSFTGHTTPDTVPSQKNFIAEDKPRPPSAESSTTRDNILKGIEDPKSPIDATVEKKLNTITRTSSQTEEKKGYGNNDPYREPLT